MKSKLETEIRACESLSDRLGRRLESALPGVDPSELDRVLKLVIRVNELTLNISQFGEELRMFRLEALEAASEGKRLGSFRSRSKPKGKSSVAKR